MHSSSRSSTTRPERAPVRLALAVLCFLGACLAGQGSAPAADPSGLQFTDVTKDSRLWFKHEFGAKKLQTILMTTGSGCALFDYDNDGWLDAFLVNGTRLDAQGRPIREGASHHALFKNRRNGTFENVTRRSGITAATYGQGCACADFDGDGFTDLYITNYGRNRLYRNKGDGTFEDVTRRSGTGCPLWSTGAVFFDYDGDRDLDLYVSNYVSYRPGMKGVHASELSKRMGFKFFPGPRDYSPLNDVLYRNEGDGTFRDVTHEVGLSRGGNGLSVVAGDFDGDGDQDLFVANDASPNFLYRNDGGRFKEMAKWAGVAYDPGGSDTAAMGVDVADINGDGRQDLYVTNMVFEFNNLYVNQGKMLFRDQTRTAGLDDDNFRCVGWATRLADFNLDGNLDCFVANGHVVDYVEGFSQSVTYGQQNQLFLGNGRGTFRNVADRIGDVMRKKRVSRGGAFGDYDNDGDIDILLINSGQRARLLRNDLPRNRRWVKVRLRGNAPNTAGLGSKVSVRAGGRTYRNEVRFAPGYLSSSDPTVHVGLPPGAAGGTVEVVWPSGRRETRPFKAGTLLLIEESRAGGSR